MPHLRLSSVFIFVAIGYDVIGYESKIPDISKIESVAFNNNSGFRRTHSNSEAIFENHDEIQAVRELHHSLIESQYITHRNRSHSSVHLIYHMKDDSILTRYYSYDQISSNEKLKDLVNSETYIKSEHSAFNVDPEEIEIIRFNWELYDREELTITDKSHIYELIQLFKKDALSESYKERYEDNLTYAHVQFISDSKDSFEYIGAESYRRSNNAVKHWLEENNYINDLELTSDKIEKIKT